MTERPISEAQRKVSTFPAKESWFRAATAGNALLPQTTYGFTITTLAAVLNDPPLEWIEFAKSRYTNDQKKRQGKIVSHLHMKYAVIRVTKPYMTEKTDRLFDSELQQVWQYQTLPPVTQALLSMRYKRSIDIGGYGAEYQAIKRIGEVQEYFKDPVHLSEAATIASRARDILLFDRDIRKVAKEYRNTIRTYLENNRSRNDLFPVASEAVEQVHSILAPQLHSQFHSEDLAWIGS